MGTKTFLLSFDAVSNSTDPFFTTSTSLQVKFDFLYFSKFDRFQVRLVSIHKNKSFTSTDPQEAEIDF